MTDFETRTSAKPVMLLAAMWMAVIGSSMAVIYSNHICRTLYAELAVLEQEKNSLQVNWGRFLLEKSSWVSLGRVESQATAELKMRVPEAHEIVMVSQ